MTSQESNYIEEKNQIKKHKFNLDFSIKKKKNVKTKKDLLIINEISEISKNNDNYSSLKDIKYNAKEEQKFQINTLRTMPSATNNNEVLYNDNMFNKESMKSIMKVLNSKNDTEKKDNKKSIFYSQTENKLPLKREASENIKVIKEEEERNKNTNGEFVKKFRKFKKSRRSHQVIKKAESKIKILAKKTKLLQLKKKRLGIKKNGFTKSLADKKVHFNLSNAQFKNQNNVQEIVTDRHQYGIFPDNEHFYGNMPSPVHHQLNNNITFSPPHHYQIVDRFSDDNVYQEQMTKRKESYIKINGTPVNPEYQYNRMGSNLFKSSQPTEYPSNIPQGDVNKYMNYFEINENQINLK